MGGPDDPGLVAELLQTELALARRDFVSIAGGLDAVLDPEFVEFGSSGRTWDRPATIAMAAASSPAELTISDFAVERLADGVALATYRLSGVTPGGERRETLRSSVWVRRDRWVMRFHQGTRADV